jgi:Domain of unknown function (DUF1996)
MKPTHISQVSQGWHRYRGMTLLRRLLTSKSHYAFGASLLLLGNCGGGGCRPIVPTPSGASANYAIPGAAAGSGQLELVGSNSSIQRPSGDGTGNFRTTCTFSHMNYDDSIVFPGQPGKSHMHTYFGNTGSNAGSSANSLFTSGTSTCDGGIANRSSYWVPSLIDASGTPVIPTYNMIYYKSGYQGSAPASIVATLPVGLKMVTGDPMATTPQADYVKWECSGTAGKQTSIPACGPGNILKATIEFPQCWDGRNLDSPDHRSHMAYGSWERGCPADHPVAIPVISFNIDYPVGPGGTSGWRLASDMYSGGPGGYSLHGDIITAWDPAVSSQWLNNCVRQDADCHVSIISDSQSLG